jgi:hypothetical protein
MMFFRGIVAAAMVVIGIVLAVRLLSTGFHPEILTGLVLSAALIALGLHKLKLILRARGVA